MNTEQPTITYTTADTIAALMDAFVEAEQPALNCEMLLRAGVQPDEKMARMGLESQKYAAYRTANGTAALRASLIAFAAECDAAWDDVPDDVKDAVIFAWDFEFIPACLKLRVVDGLYGEAWRAAVTRWVLQEVVTDTARTAKDVLGREAATAAQLKAALAENQRLRRAAEDGPAIVVVSL